MVEDDIEGPLVLVDGPVIGDGMFTKDLGMNGVELASDAVEELGPFGFELTIHQALSFGPVGIPGKAVVLLQVVETGGLHLSRQPCPPVEADLNGEREPGLNTGIEEAEDRVDLVVVEEQAFARAPLQLDFFSQAIAMDLKLGTGFETTEHAHQSAAHLILGQDVAGDSLFVDLTGIEILHRSSASLGFGQGSFFRFLS